MRKRMLQWLEEAETKRVLSSTPLFDRISQPSWDKAAKAATPSWLERIARPLPRLTPNLGKGADTQRYDKSRRG